MQRRAILQISPCHGVDSSCRPTRLRLRPRGFPSNPAYLFRRTFRSSHVVLNATDPPSPTDNEGGASASSSKLSRPKFGNRWGSSTTKQAALSQAEKAARDALVEKQAQELQQKKAREQQTAHDRIQQSARHLPSRLVGGQGHRNLDDRKLTAVRKIPLSAPGTGHETGKQHVRIRYSSPIAPARREKKDTAQPGVSRLIRHSGNRSPAPGRDNSALLSGSRAVGWSCPECGHRCLGQHSVCPICKTRKPSEYINSQGTQHQRSTKLPPQTITDAKMDQLRQSILTDISRMPGLGVSTGQMLGNQEPGGNDSVVTATDEDRSTRAAVWKTPRYRKHEIPESPREEPGSHQEKFKPHDEATKPQNKTHEISARTRERIRRLEDESTAGEQADQKDKSTETYDSPRVRGFDKREGKKAREPTNHPGELESNNSQRFLQAGRKTFRSRENRRERVSVEAEDFDREEYQRRRQQRRTMKQEKATKREKEKEEEQGPSPLYLPAFISVINLADVIGVRPGLFVRRMEDMGFEDITYDHILDAETAGLVAAEFNFEPIFDMTGGEDLTAAPELEDRSVLPSRPPVVAIMGHVDHGKTTILDWLRKSSVAASEHGGITQHIGAFSVTMPSGKTITFLDTPGHEAFLEMRRRGANVTDIIILVVAADDSVKPQTIEAIKHATASGVPIVVAMSKIDKPGINTEKVKQDLSVQGIHVEDYGGDVQAIGVSGKTGKGMVELEEAILTLSEMLDHRADYAGNVEGWVIEASTKSHGRVATVLIRRGTLRQGDIIVAGTTWARVRTLRNETGTFLEQATPGMPVEIDGWREQPVAGAEILQAPDEQRAKDVVQIRTEKSETEKLGEDTMAMNQARRAALEKRRQEDAGIEPEAEQEQTGPKRVNFIIKADVSGSAEAVMNSVMAIGTNEVYANVLRSTVGQVSESDIEYAASSNAYLISFNTSIDPNMGRMAEKLGVIILNHNIIYKLMDAVKDILSDYLPPLVSHRVTGEAEISQIFEITVKRKQKTSIAGCKVRNGVISIARKVRVLRGQEVIYDGTIASLKNVKKDVTEMRKDSECGMAFSDWTGFEPGDHVQCYEELYEKRQL